MLIATLLMTVILAALATVTAQWLPNWNRGLDRVQRTERLALGLDRIAADLSAAEMIPTNVATSLPVFDGGELAVTFVRTAIGPNAGPGSILSAWPRPPTARALHWCASAPRSRRSRRARSSVSPIRW